QPVAHIELRSELLARVAGHRSSVRANDGKLVGRVAHHHPPCAAVDLKSGKTGLACPARLDDPECAAAEAQQHNRRVIDIDRLAYRRCVSTYRRDFTQVPEREVHHVYPEVQSGATPGLFWIEEPSLPRSPSFRAAMRQPCANEVGC